MIYIVIWEDRHADTELYPFFFKKDALKEARSLVGMIRNKYEVTENLTPSMEKVGWSYFAGYSEGGCVYVVEKDLK